MSSTTYLNETELKIAQFFKKRVRERIIYLMFSKKRGEIFKRLAHTAENYLDCSLIVEKNDFPLKCEIIEKYLGKTVYVMAEHSALNGKVINTDKTLEELWSCGVPYILYGNGFLYVETEYVFSVHTAYILKRNDKI